MCGGGGGEEWLLGLAILLQDQDSLEEGRMLPGLVSELEFEGGKMDGPMSEAASCPPVLPMALRKALPKFNISSGLKTGERSRADGDVLAPAPSLTPQAQS